MIKLKNPEFERNLVLSTGHMTKQDSEILEAAATGNPSTNLIVYSSEYWFLVFCADNNSMSNAAVARANGLISEELYQCLVIGNEERCIFVKFDRDGPQHDELPLFDW